MKIGVFTITQLCSNLVKFTSRILITVTVGVKWVKEPIKCDTSKDQTWWQVMRHRRQLYEKREVQDITLDGFLFYFSVYSKKQFILENYSLKLNMRKMWTRKFNKMLLMGKSFSRRRQPVLTEPLLGWGPRLSVRATPIESTSHLHLWATIKRNRRRRLSCDTKPTKPNRIFPRGLLDRKYKKEN